MEEIPEEMTGVPGTVVNSTRTWRYLLFAPETFLSGTLVLPDFSVRAPIR